MKLKINERFATQVVGKNYSTDGDVLFKEYDDEKYIVELKVEDGCGVITETIRGLAKDRIKTYRADAIIKGVALDSRGDKYFKTSYTLNGVVKNCIYGYDDKETRLKFSTFNSFKEYAKQLTYKEIEIIDFYTPEMVTTIRTVEELGGKEFDNIINEMIGIGWELVTVSHLIMQNGNTKHVGTLKKEHEKFDIV